MDNLLLLPALFLIAAVIAAEPQSAAQSSPPDSGDFQISVNVHLVVLNATVRDRKGQFAPDLSEPDFAVYEDGVRQTLRLFRHEDLPVTVGLVVDHSGSMRRKLAHVIAAARTFVQSSNPKDEMFVINFNEHVTLGLPPGIRFTDRPDQLALAISLAPATGQTALYDAICQAQQHLRDGAPDKKVLVIISDGGDNASKHRLPEVLKLAEESSALIYTIGIYDTDDEDRKPDVLRCLASVTGGDAFFPGKFSEVVEVCQRIAHDIRHQYTLGYVSTHAADPGLRTVRVTASAAGAGKLTVRTRTGYIGQVPQ